MKEEYLENTVCQVTAFIRPFLRKEVEKAFNGVSLTMESIMVLGHFKPVPVGYENILWFHFVNVKYKRYSSNQRPDYFSLVS